MNKNKLHVSRCGFLILLVVVWCTPASAQHASDNLGVTFGTPAGATIKQNILDRIARRNRERRIAARRSGASTTARTSSASAPPVAKLSESSVLFRPTGTQLKTREIANVIDAGNPEVFKLLTTLLEEFDKETTAAGHPNDLALAMSFFLANNASIYHDAGEPSDPQMIELRDVVTEALVEGNALSSMSDRKKQEMYEALVLFTGLALASYHEGKQSGNAETVKVSQKLAGQNLLTVMGISPDKITFTAQGLNIETEAAAVTSTPTQSNTEPTISGNAPAPTLSSSDFLDFDPFPDKPYVQPQKLLIGRLRKTITTADLAGTWEIGGASVQTYVSSGTNSYTDASFYGKKYFIRSDGTFDSKFQGRASNTTIRESDSGIVILDGGFITLKSKQNPAMRYQFVAFMNLPNGAAVLSLICIGDNAPLDGDALRANCSHSNGYVSCLNGEEWVQTQASSSPTPTSATVQNDPFPDRPGYAPQKPLSGTLNATITMADLVGTWDHGAGSVQTYIDSYTGDYSRTNTTFYGEQYSIRSDGTFTYKFVGRSNNKTVRELDTGNVILSGGYITFEFKGRTTEKFQFIAFMTQPNGAAIISLVKVGENEKGYDAAAMSMECGHGDGFIRCVGGEEWARLARPAK